MIGFLLAAILASAGAPSGVLAQAVDAPRAPEPEAMAPPGRWTMEGGNAARTGSSFARPLRREPVVAWTVTLRGEVEGEPRVWDGSVVVCARETGGRRAIQVLELATGRTLLHQVLHAPVPLEPALWNDRIVVRAAENRIDVYRTRAGRLFLLRAIKAARAVSAPVVVDGELYLRVDDELVCYDLARPEPAWTAELEGVVRGRPSVRGDGVYALTYDARGNAFAVLVARADGRVLDLEAAGHHGGEVPEHDEEARLTVLPEAVFVDYPRPVASTAGPALGTARFARSLERPELGAGGLHELRVPPTPWRGGWLMLEESAGAASWLWSRREEERLMSSTLADAESHGELLRAGTPASLAGDVAYFGGIAVDLVTRDILWKRAAPLARPVPADGFLLVVERPRELTALREPARSLPHEARAAREAAEVDRATAEAYASLAHRSLPIGDPELTRRLIARAVRLGARGRALDAARDGLDRMPAGSRPAGWNSRRLEGLAVEERALEAQPAEKLLELAEAARAPGLERALLRAALERTPDDLPVLDSVLGAVRRLVPPEAPRSRTFDAASWLDFLDVHERAPVRFITGDGASAAEAELLAEQRRGWRDDVVGLRSERLFVVTPPGRPGAVARCLELGEVVCDILEELFEARGSSAGAAAPMTLILYESRAEYVEHSQSVGSGPESALGWTAGHYSSRENLSRMFVPEDDENLERLLGVYVHELTHHWLATRAPFASRMNDSRLPFWIVEGFATLVEEFLIDPRTGEWDPVDPRADSLDTVAHADPEALLPWRRVLRMSHDDFTRLDRTETTRVPRSWKLGMVADQTDVGLFYAQAGAICHYLLRASDEKRAQLARYVAAWYSHDAAALYAARAFGMTAEELGRRVVELARAEMLDD